MKKLKDILEGTVVPFPKKKVDSGKPDSNHFDKWHKESLGYHGKFEGRSVTKTDAYEHYYIHADQHNVKPMSIDDFHKHMSDKGHISGKIAGTSRYVGLGLKYEHEE